MAQMGPVDRVLILRRRGDVELLRSATTGSVLLYFVLLYLSCSNNATLCHVSLVLEMIELVCTQNISCLYHPLLLAGSNIRFSFLDRKSVV